MRGSHIVPAGIFGGSALLFLVLVSLTGKPILSSLLVFVGLVCLIVLVFFRDPERLTPHGDGLILSAADGRVCSVERVDEHLHLRGEGITVGVYLSLFNVHVNRIPISGVVRLLTYKPGRFFPAFRKKASLENEQQIIGIDNDRGRVLVRQIAGSIARRIVCRLSVGDSVKAGDRFGKITFGSRVELVLPAHWNITVKVGDRVRAGETIIGVIQ